MDERMEEALRGFLRHLAAKGYSQEVVADYGEDLEVFLTFLMAQGVKDLKAVGEGPLRAYEEWLSGSRDSRDGEALVVPDQGQPVEVGEGVLPVDGVDGVGVG